MTRPEDLLLGQLLRLERQLARYRRHHEDEMAELRRALNGYKRAIADLVDESADESDLAEPANGVGDKAGKDRGAQPSEGAHPEAPPGQSG